MIKYYRDPVKILSEADEEEGMSPAEIAALSAAGVGTAGAGVVGARAGIAGAKAGFGHLAQRKKDNILFGTGPVGKLDKELALMKAKRMAKNSLIADTKPLVNAYKGAVGGAGAQVANIKKRAGKNWGALLQAARNIIMLKAFAPKV